MRDGDEYRMGRTGALADEDTRVRVRGAGDLEVVGLELDITQNVLTLVLGPAQRALAS